MEEDFDAWMKREFPRIRRRWAWEARLPVEVRAAFHLGMLTERHASEWADAIAEGRSPPAGFPAAGFLLDPSLT